MPEEVKKAFFAHDDHLSEGDFISEAIDCE
jgi:hypothetical protein